MSSEVTTKMLHKARRSAQRTRAVVACEGCKSRKAKCSGFQPCSRCAKGSRICIFKSEAGDQPDNLRDFGEIIASGSKRLTASKLDECVRPSQKEKDRLQSQDSHQIDETKTAKIRDLITQDSNLEFSNRHNTISSFITHQRLVSELNAGRDYTAQPQEATTRGRRLNFQDDSCSVSNDGFAETRDPANIVTSVSPLSRQRDRLQLSRTAGEISGGSPGSGSHTPVQETPFSIDSSASYGQQTGTSSRFVGPPAGNGATSGPDRTEPGAHRLSRQREQGSDALPFAFFGGGGGGGWICPPISWIDGGGY